MVTATRTTRRPAGTRRITFYVALAMFAQESTWNFYDNRVPELLRDHVASAAVAGLLMGMDNLLGVFIQPYMGNRSDNTRTSWGRRIPYLAVMMPVGALLFLLIPLATSLAWLILVIFLYALVMNGFRPVSESLMPDFIEPERRSRANAAVKTASALTTIVAALVSLLLVDDHPKLAFAVPSALMLVAAAVLVWRVRDSRSAAYRAALVEDERAAATGSHGPDAEIRVRGVLRELVTDPDRSRLLLIVAVFTFAAAWFASRSLMTPYGVEVLGLSDGEAGGLTLPSGIAYILAAFPAALLAERFGRLRVIAAGMAVFAAGMVAATAVQSPAATVVALCLAAAGAAGFMINAVVVLWNLAPSSRVLGTYSGLYTVGWAGGGIAGPGLVGLAVDVTGWRTMLLHIAVLAVVAIVLITRIDRPRRGSAAEGSAS
ncbi:MFS transporter [Actinomadura madurae]|uniref:MFS transporter n=1 Tax=Actinomadura madurae TaxID=1993 RepID=UPI0020D24EE5|nr:MFS transporter [Actinomadura madurae]MCP9980597.1 MFS transporter [Actinomadura madurae]MCQ0007889.1 MFS transporter [Actinomadura madurae]MCQ0016799.1 MFS transporter [Actinomadura madurae]